MALMIAVTFGCNRVITLSLSEPGKDEVIAFQPLDDYNIAAKKSTIKYIGNFFKRKVVVLPAINTPDTYFDTVVKRYSADSILMLIAQLHKNKFIEVVVLTNKNIYTLKENLPLYYYDTDLIGFAYQPGNTCVISDRTFDDSDTAVVQQLRNNIVHEVGHNMALSHCIELTCAMSGERPGADYCKY